MIDKALIGIAILILILFLIWREGKESHKLALLFILTSNDAFSEPQSPEISIYIRIALILICILFFLLCAWLFSGEMQGEY
jgi:hypothetical protein